MALSVYNFLSHLPFFKVGKIMAGEIWKFDAAGAFTDKISLDIDFADKTVVQCGVTAVTVFLSVMVIYK